MAFVRGKRREIVLCMVFGIGWVGLRAWQSDVAYAFWLMENQVRLVSRLII